MQMRLLRAPFQRGFGPIVRGVTVSLSCRMPLPFLRNTGAWGPCQALSLALWNPFPHQEFVTIPGELSLLLGAA